MAAAFYFSIPGPRMVWEFGELGYDYSRCYLSTNGEGGDCNKKLDPKPIRWDYQQDAGRRRQFEIYAGLMKLRKNYPNTFIAGAVNASLGGAFKSIQLVQSDLSLTGIGNFDVNPATGSVTFSNSGTWYNYLTGEPFTATGAVQSFTLAPGEYKLFVNKNVVNAVVTGISDVIADPNKLQAFVYPNPVGASTQVVFSIPSTSMVSLRLSDLQGKTLSTHQLGTLVKGKHQLNLGGLQPGILQWTTGVYLLTLSSGNGSVTTRIIL